MRDILRVGAVVVAVLVPGGCTTVADPQPLVVDELAAHDGAPCPAVLPSGSDPAQRGLGTNEAAPERPVLRAADAAWVCQYGSASAGAGPDGDGSSYEWRRVGEPRAVTAASLALLTLQLDALEPGGPTNCRADLGPRWVLVLSHRGDLTGVAVDDYGCGSVRLTGDPYATAPGDPGEEGAVPGVLSAPDGLLDALKSTEAATMATHVGHVLRERVRPRPLAQSGPRRLSQHRVHPKGFEPLTF